MTYVHPVVKNVHLTVNNLDSTMSFYQDILGFRILERSNNKASLTADGKTAMIILEEEKQASPRNIGEAGLYHIAFLVPSRSDLADILHYFIQTGFRLHGASDHEVSEALYLADPEGNGIEIYTDRPKDLWKWNKGQVSMDSKVLDAEDLLKEGSTAGWQGMPEQTVIGHIHLQVTELEKTLKYYHEGLGFDLVHEYGDQALFMSKYSYHHHIALNIWNSAGGMKRNENSTGLHSFTIVYPNDHERDQAVNELQKLEAWVSREGGKVITKDPSGIHMILEVKGE